MQQTLTLLRVADSLFVWSLPIWSLGCVLHTSPSQLLALGVPLGIVGLHRLVTAGRPNYWQLIPSTFGWCAAFVSLSTSSSLLGVLGIAVNIIFPMPRLEPRKGRYSVGVVDYEVAVSDDAPPIIGRMFYPASAQHTASTPYIAFRDRHGLTRKFMTVAAPPFLRKLLPERILNHWAAMRIEAMYAAELAADGRGDDGAQSAGTTTTTTTTTTAARLPVILFSHGLTASRETSSSLAMSLAATSGAVVLLAEHTDASSSLARFADGSVVEYDHRIFELGAEPATDAYREARRAQTASRAAELEAALAFVAALHSGEAHSGDAHRGGGEQGGGSSSSSSSRVTRSSGRRRVGIGRVSLGGGDVSAEQSARLLSSFRGRLAIGHVAVGGHSFGGAAALCLAAEHYHPAAAPPSRPPSSRPPEHAAVRVGACFVLDPAVDWTPTRTWVAIGYDGVYNDTHRKSATAAAADGAARGGAPPRGLSDDFADVDAPPLATCLPMLTVWSEQWAAWCWYQRWARQLCASRGALAPANTLIIAGCGHQGLCDLAYTLPHWMNVVLKNTLGAPSAEMDRALTASVLGFLQNANVLKPSGECGDEVVDLRTIAMTKGH